MSEEFKAGFMKPKKNIKIDELDRKILYVLSINSRFTNTVISQLTGVSKDKINYRLKRLEEIGFIDGYMTIIDNRKLGYQNYMVFIKLNNLVSKQDILNKLDNIEEVSLIQHVGGSWDILVLISVKEIDKFYPAFYQVLEIGSINSYKIVQQIDDGYTGLGYLAAKSFRSKFNVPRSNSSSFFKELDSQKASEKLGLNDSDIKLLKLINLNARIPLAELSKEMNMTIPGVKYRIEKMANSGIIRGFIPMYSVSDLGLQWHQILIKNTRIEKSKLIAFFKEHVNITWYDQFIGEWNFMVSIFTKDNFEYNQTIEDLRKTFPDRILRIDTLTIFEQFKFVQPF